MTKLRSLSRQQTTCALKYCAIANAYIHVNAHRKCVRGVIWVVLSLMPLRRSLGHSPDRWIFISIQLTRWWQYHHVFMSTCAGNSYNAPSRSGEREASANTRGISGDLCYLSKWHRCCGLRSTWSPARPPSAVGSRLCGCMTDCMCHSQVEPLSRCSKRDHSL